MQLFHSARLFLFFSLLFPYLSGDAGGGMFGWNPFASFGRSRYNCSGLESYPTNCDSSNNISSKRKKIKIIHISINAEFPPAAKVQRFSGWRFFLMSWCPLISSFFLDLVWQVGAEPNRNGFPGSSNEHRVSYVSSDFCPFPGPNHDNRVLLYMTTIILPTIEDHHIGRWWTLPRTIYMAIIVLVHLRVSNITFP